MTIFEERGLFWWHHELVPDRHFAPDASVSGLLKIDEDGIIALELDGHLASDSMSVLSIFATGPHADLKGKRIQGILKVSTKTVLLDGLQRSGGRFASNGPSFEEYQATHCLVGNIRLPKDGAPFSANSFEIEMQGFEEWLRLGNIRTTRTDTKVVTTYTRVDDLVYDYPEGQLKISYNIYSPILGLARHIVELKETVSLIYYRNSDMAVEDISEEYGILRDLFVILTDSEYPLN